jgi:hypothetical protein
LHSAQAALGFDGQFEPCRWDIWDTIDDRNG